MNISVISYSFVDLLREGKQDLFGYLETCRYRYGLSTADIWNGTLQSTEDDYLAKVKDGLMERELALVNLAVDGAHFWEDDPQVREQHYQRALANARAAEVLGARTLRIDAGGGRNDTGFTNEQFGYIAAKYRELAKRANDGGYRVGPENHWGPEMVPAVLKRLCEAVDNPAFGVLLHFNRWKGDDAQRGDDLIAPWAMHTHTGGQLSLEALEGKMNLLRASGYQGCWGVEMRSTRYSAIGAQVALVRDALEKWRVPEPAK